MSRSIILFALAVATALGQLGAAFATGDRGEVGALAVGWAGALWLVRLGRHALGQGGGLLDKAIGAGLWVAALVVTLEGGEPYQRVGRFMPLVAGVGLATLASGFSGLSRYLRPFVLLGVTLIDPLPRVIRGSEVPIEMTAMLAASFLRLVGVPVDLEGASLHLSGGSLEVISECAGHGIVASTLVLGVLVLCLFPGRLWQGIAVLVSAVVVGFAVNAARISFLALVASRSPDEFAYWHRHQIQFPVLAAGLAGVVWWLMLRQRHQTRRRQRAACRSHAVPGAHRVTAGPPPS